MKKFLLLFAVIGSVTIAKAQTELTYGVKGGLNLSAVGGKDTDGNKMKAGFHVGVFAELPVATSISVRPELVFSNQGSKYEDDGGKGSVNASYITLPVMAKYRFAGGFFAETGPQLGYLVSAKAKQGGEKSDMKDMYRKTDLSWALGVGYLSKTNIGVNARFNYGLSKVDKEGDFKAYNRVFQVGLFYVLGANTSTN